MPARPLFLPLAGLLLASLFLTTASAVDRQHEVSQDGQNGGGGSLPPSLFEPQSDWGCEVLLCLANPGSPTEFAECVDPIEKLWEHLAKGRSFPRCSMGGDEAGNYARQDGDHIHVYVDGQLFKSFQWRGGSGGPGDGGGRPDPGGPVEQIR